MKPLYTSKELRAMIHACNTHEELNKVEYYVQSLEAELIPFELLKTFSFGVGIKRCVLNNKENSK